MMYGNLKIGLFLSLFLFVESLAFTQITCTEVSTASGIDYSYSSVSYMGGGAAFFDMDNDGDDDIWMAGGVNRDVLYENLGHGQFDEIGTEAGIITSGIVSSGVITGDLDNDGYRDVVVLPHIGFHPRLYRNNGDGTFSEISEQAGLGPYEAQCHAGAMSDVNLDGFLDIYLGNYIENLGLVQDGDGNTIGFDHECYKNFLFINNGDWTFTEAGETYGIANQGCALATTFTDYDLDNDPDLLIANDFGEWILPNALYENDYPNDSFPDISLPTGMDVGIYGMGIATGDFDKDLDLDYYITNLGRNVLLENQGDGIFEDKTAETGTEDAYMDSLLATGWGTAFIDVDNDVDLDLFVCNGYVPAAPFITDSKQNRNRLFINNNNEDGTGFRFEETAYNSGLDDLGRGRGFAYSDFDNDGDLDFFVVNVNQHTAPDSIENVGLFRNDIDNDLNWLKVKLEGTSNNRDGFGSIIKIVVGDQSWIHDYNGGFGTHASQNSSIAHFGLGEYEVVDSLIVTWPGGQSNSFTDIPPKQTITISESGELTQSSHLSILHEEYLKVYPNPFKVNARIEFKLEESDLVKMEVFDLLGRKVDTILEEFIPGGLHQIKWTAPNTVSPTSIYLIKLQTSKRLLTKQLIRTF